MRINQIGTFAFYSWRFADTFSVWISVKRVIFRLTCSYRLHTGKLLRDGAAHPPHWAHIPHKGCTISGQHERYYFSSLVQLSIIRAGLSHLAPPRTRQAREARRLLVRTFLYYLWHVLSFDISVQHCNRIIYVCVPMSRAFSWQRVISRQSKY